MSFRKGTLGKVPNIPLQRQRVTVMLRGEVQAIISLTKGSLDVVSEPDRPARDTDAEDAIEITPEMISAGVAALKAYDPEREEPEALVFAILYRAFTIAVRNAKAAMAPLAE